MNEMNDEITMFKLNITFNSIWGGGGSNYDP
jgi:hypothetical protein